MQKSVLIIGHCWPEPQSTAAGVRMLQLLQFFLEEGFEVVFSSTAMLTERSFDLAALGVKTTPVTLNHGGFDTFIAQLAPTIVLFDRFLTEEQFGWRVAEFAPQALRMLDTEDLHSLRKTREACFRQNHIFSLELWLQDDITKREIASIYRCDIALIISKFEMQLLEGTIKIDGSLLHYMPFMVSPMTATEMDALPPFGARKGFICIGNGKHAPNVDAVLWLKTELWPLIRAQLPEAALNIYGAYLPDRLTQMHNPREGFLVHGWAQDLKETMQFNKVNLAPLRFGAGLKGKLADAMQFGTPSVTTPIGGEGMGDETNFAGIIAPDAISFAAAAIELYTDQNLWQSKHQEGFKMLNLLFDKERHMGGLRVKIHELLTGLEAHRSQNFIGSMLRHQSMASAKYMAKYIEEKNKQNIL